LKDPVLFFHLQLLITDVIVWGFLLWQPMTALYTNTRYLFLDGWY